MAGYGTAREEPETTSRRWIQIRPSVAVGCIAAAAFLVRLLHVFSCEPAPRGEIFVHVDMALNRLTLRSLFDPDGFSWFAPWYALFLKPFLLITERHTALRGVAIAQAALGAWTCILIYRLARRLHSRRAGLAAALLTCFYPHFIFFSSVLLTENLLIPLFLSALLLILRAARRPSARRFLLAGAVAAAAVLLRPAALCLAPAALLAAWGTAPDPAGRRRAIGWMAIGALALMAPWAARNTIAYGRPVFIAPGVGIRIAADLVPSRMGTSVGMNERGDALWRTKTSLAAEAFEFVSSDPWGAVHSSVRTKWRRIWELIPPGPLRSSNAQLYIGEHFFPYASWSVVLFLGLLGAGALMRRGGTEVRTVFGCAVSFVLGYLIVLCDSRLRLPIESLFLAASGAAIVTLAGKVPRLSRARANAWATAAVLFLAGILIQSETAAFSARRALRDASGILGSVGRVAIDPGRSGFPLFGEGRIPLDRTRGRYLLLDLTSRRTGNERFAPGRGGIQITFFDRNGQTLTWLNNPLFLLETLPSDRWTPLTFKAHIPPAAVECQITCSMDRTSPDHLVLDGVTLRYARGNDAAMEFLYPYVRYRE